MAESVEELIGKLNLAFNVDMLLKHEIQYELMARDVRPVGTADEYRKLLRTALTDNVPTVLCKFTQRKFDEELEQIHELIDTVNNILTETDLILTETKLKRTETKLSHIINRYTICKESNYFKELGDKTDWNILDDSLKKLLVLYLDKKENPGSSDNKRNTPVEVSTELTTSVTTSTSTFITNVTTSTGIQALGTIADNDHEKFKLAYAGNFNPTLAVDRNLLFTQGLTCQSNNEINTTSGHHYMTNVNTVNQPQFVNVEPVMSPATYDVKSKIVHPSYTYPQLRTNRPAFDYSLAHNVFVDNYAKLPNPIQQYLQKIRICDGLNVDELLNFINITLKIRNLKQLSDYSLFQVLIPHMEGLVKERAFYSMCNGISYDQFHDEILKTCIPTRLRSRLEQDQYYRLQRNGEPLQTFIMSIKESAHVLRLNKSEQEIVDTIIEGLNPTERQRLIFTPKPTSFVELNNLCILSQNVRYTDMQRLSTERNTCRTPRNQFQENVNNENVSRRSNPNFQNVTFKPIRQHTNFNTNVPVPNSQFQNMHISNISSIPNRSNQANNSPNKPVEFKCYYCNKPGHMARNCFLKNQYNSKNDSGPATKPNG